jgi:hypothetical protein
LTSCKSMCHAIDFSLFRNLGPFLRREIWLGATLSLWSGTVSRISWPNTDQTSCINVYVYMKIQ